MGWAGRMGSQAGFVEGRAHGVVPLLPPAVQGCREAREGAAEAYDEQSARDEDLSLLIGTAGEGLDGHHGDEGEGSARDGEGNCIALGRGASRGGWSTWEVPRTAGEGGWLVAWPK